MLSIEPDGRQGRVRAGRPHCPLQRHCVSESGSLGREEHAGQGVSGASHVDGRHVRGNDLRDGTARADQLRWVWPVGDEDPAEHPSRNSVGEEGVEDSGDVEWTAAAASSCNRRTSCCNAAQVKSGPH